MNFIMKKFSFQKDAIVEKLHGENDQLKNDLQHLQSIHNASVSDERFLIAANSPSIAAAVRIIFDFIVSACQRLENIFLAYFDAID